MCACLLNKVSYMNYADQLVFSTFYFKHTYLSTLLCTRLYLPWCTPTTTFFHAPPRFKYGFLLMHSLLSSTLYYSNTSATWNYSLLYINDIKYGITTAVKCSFTHIPIFSSSYSRWDLYDSFLYLLRRTNFASKLKLYSSFSLAHGSCNYFTSFQHA